MKPVAPVRNTDRYDQNNVVAHNHGNNDVEVKVEVAVDCNAIEKAITSRTVAILVVHPFGMITASNDEMKKIRGMADSKSLKRKLHCMCWKIVRNPFRVLRQRHHLRRHLLILVVHTQIFPSFPLE
jgi:hypothetical protein